jgi:predicted ATPase/DNA-binding XRE family transcriptional regulator
MSGSTHYISAAQNPPSLGSDMTTGNPHPFGELLRRLRTAATLTQEELAERAGLSVRAVSDLERGVHQAPRLETVRMLADALRLEATDRAGLIAARPGDAASSPIRAPGSSLLAGLPATWTRLIGREAEIAAVCRLLVEQDVRLLTLTGPGGVGKTRLAQQVAADLGGDFAHGLAWVPLGAVRDATFVAPTVAHALGVREASDLSSLQGLAAALRDRRLLLVLDNFEQVLEAAPFVAQLLAACRGLKVLVTSRSVLRLSGEQHYPVPPLALPDPAAPPSQLAESEAVRLFVARAQEANPIFVLTQENAESVATICRRLDGLPLAIELAAARLRYLAPDGLLARLQERQALLTGGPRDAPARQQTLQATIAWSYDLLEPAEQRLFRHTSVFVGGCTFEAAVAVDRATGDLEISSGRSTAGQIAELDTLGGIASLIDQSLLQRGAPVSVGSGAVEPRFTMLETIREFGVKELEGSGAAAVTRSRHAVWYTALAEQAEPALYGSRDQLRWVNLLTAEHDNLRAALAWLIEAQDAEMSQQLAGALPRFWFTRGHISEGRGWLERALALGADTPPAIRVRALCGLGVLAGFQHDYQRAATVLDEAMVIAEAANLASGVAYAHFGQGLLCLHQSDFVSAMAHGVVSRDGFETLDEWGRASMAHLLMARAAHYSGDLAMADELYEQFLEIALRLDDVYIIAHARQSLALLAQSRGDYERALPHYIESFELYRLCAEPWSIAACLAGVASVIAVRGRAEQAAQLLGAAEELHIGLGMPMFDADRTVMGPAMAAIRTALDDATIAETMAAGAALSLDQAIAMALAVSRPVNAETVPERGEAAGGGLTRGSARRCT